jgi:DNA mismatch repair protein MutS
MSDDQHRVTPSMAQFIEIKAANPDSLLFYRMGDFYELFFEDAEIASRTLGIVLTKRGKHQDQDIPMCGVPVARADDYLQRLIAAGHRVAVCEQLEDPAEARKRGSKAVVRRDVVRLVTPGTITEEALLDPARANLLVALARRRLPDGGIAVGVAALDISTGRFDLCETTPDALPGEIARLDPREIVLPDTLREEPSLLDYWRGQSVPVTAMAREGLDASAGERRLCDWFGVTTLDAFGAFTRAEIAAAGMAIAYVERTQLGQRPALSPPARRGENGLMAIDAATRANLELTRTLSGERAGSLLAAIDCTVTPAGSRLMAERLSGPLTDAAAITRRQDGVAFLLAQPGLRDAIRGHLKRAPDIARALSRLALDRGGPRDLAAIRDGLMACAALAELAAPHGALPGELSDAFAALTAAPADLAALLADCLADDLPLMARDGGFVRAGHDTTLDEARLLQADSRKVIAALQARYAQETGCRALRIKHNGMIGYYVEVPQAAGEDLLKDPWRQTFVHRQTMAGAMRFSTTELGGLEARIASAGAQGLSLELAHFARLREAVLAASPSLKQAAEALAVLDLNGALAHLAAEAGWVRPNVDDGLAFRIVAGRHPVVEAACRAAGKPFVANDCELSPQAGAEAGRITLITGPNMAGKSTFLRQNALICILAQMGAFVPATSAHIGVVDKLFSRVGAADDLARGRSTFMVEMIETATILNQAGPCSLVILDEIGRGTATFDGLSIAWATIEHLHEANRCRSLFATHYHELTALSERLPRMTNATVRVTEWKGEVVFLHEVVPGVADGSYGIQVAKLAGLPPAVIERARVVLTELETSERERPAARLVDDLPLFSAATRRQAAPVPAAGPDPLREALTGIDPDDLTPREALEALYRLKRLG